MVVRDGPWTVTIVLQNFFLDGIDLSPPRLLLWSETPIYFDFLPFPVSISFWKGCENVLGGNSVLHGNADTIVLIGFVVNFSKFQGNSWLGWWGFTFALLLSACVHQVFKYIVQYISGPWPATLNHCVLHPIELWFPQFMIHQSFLIYIKQLLLSWEHLWKGWDMEG